MTTAHSGARTWSRPPSPKGYSPLLRAEREPGSARASSAGHESRRRATGVARCPARRTIPAPHLPRMTSSLARAALAAATLTGCAMSATSAPATSGEPITLAVVNARVWTGDARGPWADAGAVRGERLAAVGSSAEIRKLTPPGARIIDARGQMLVPGFHDAHVHFIDGGFRLASVQLRDATTPAEFIARIKAFAADAPAGAWITGGDWDHERWGGQLPERGWIDSVTPDHPVWVNRLDGHMSLANSAALRAAGVTRATPEVEGGTIVRDAAGEPTGVLKDNAMSLVNAKVPDPSPAQNDDALDAAMRHVIQ